MKLINPTLSIQNAEGPDWLVTLTHEESDGQRLTFTVKVPRTSASPNEVAMAAAAAVLPWITRLAQPPKGQSQGPLH